MSESTEPETQEPPRHLDPMLLRTTRGMLSRTGARRPALERELDKLSPAALHDLTAMVRDLTAARDREKRLRRSGQWWR